MVVSCILISEQVSYGISDISRVFAITKSESDHSILKIVIQNGRSNIAGQQLF